MAKIVGMTEVLEKTYHWTFEIRSTAPFGHPGKLIPQGVGYRRLCTSGECVLARTDDSNWPYDGGMPSDASFVINNVDAIVTSPCPPNLRDVLAALRLSVIIENRPEIERSLVDIVSHDRVLEARVAYLEKFVSEFLRRDEPAAEAMRMLGGKPMDAPADPRRLTKPLLLNHRKQLMPEISWSGPIAVVEPIVVQVRLGGLHRREVMT